MRNQHVTHLLTAYVHDQLSKRQRDRVHKHLDSCLVCRAALSREQFIKQDLKQGMPALGRPEPGQLRRLWPRIRAELRAAPPVVRLLPSFSALAMMILVAAIGVSSLFGGTSHASAAPEPLVPADIKATNTPVHTESPGAHVESLATASQTASPLLIPPQASPAPPPAHEIAPVR